MRQWRVRWQRLGMSRAKVRMYETEQAARWFALKLQGRMAEAYPDLEPDEPFCCPGTRVYECGCGGETWAERWARESAQVPPLLDGPHLDSREVGDWEPEARNVPALVPDDVREAFEAGGGCWPIREPEPDAATALDDELQDIPF
jgi:hypothetical protein